MRESAATITIHAPPERIWSILTDVSAYPEWDPACEKIVGRVSLGAKLEVFSTLVPGRGFSVTVTELAPNQKMTWSGGLPLGLFKGVRTFALRRGAGAGAAVDFTLHEILSGPMLKVIGGRMPDMTNPFDDFVSGLKRRAERGG